MNWIKAKNFEGKGAWKLCRVNGGEPLPLRIVRPDLIVDAAGKTYSYFDVEYLDETAINLPPIKQVWTPLTDEKPNTEVFAVLKPKLLLGTLKPYPEFNNFMFFHQRDNYPVGEAQGEIDPANVIWIKAVIPKGNPKEQTFTREQMITAFDEGEFAAQKRANGNNSAFTATDYMDLYFPL